MAFREPGQWDREVMLQECFLWASAEIKDPCNHMGITSEAKHQLSRILGKVFCIGEVSSSLKIYLQILELF